MGHLAHSRSAAGGDAADRTRRPRLDKLLPFIADAARTFAATS